jgi:DnaJ-class molecular chaperone
MEISTCPACHGSAKQPITVHTWTSEGLVEKEEKVNCIWCNGKGVLADDRMAIYMHYADMWCKCHGKTPTVFYKDGEHPDLFKHHYRCGVCRKVKQIG